MLAIERNILRSTLVLSTYSKHNDDDDDDNDIEKKEEKKEEVLVVLLIENILREVRCQGMHYLSSYPITGESLYYQGGKPHHR